MVFLNRCTMVSGDIAVEVPSGGDAYLLKSIVHGVDDETAVGWLRNCRHAMLDNARLLLVEMVLPTGNAPHPSKMMDLLMLVGTHGGRERTEAEFDSLLVRATRSALRRSSEGAQSGSVLSTVSR
jgi:hypothetical protein